MDDILEIAYKTACDDFIILANKCKTIDSLVDKYIEVDNEYMLQMFTDDSYQIKYLAKMRELLRGLLVNSLVADKGYKMSRIGDLSMWCM